MSKLTVVAAACVVVALLLRRRRRRQRRERRQRRINSAAKRDNRKTTNGDVSSKKIHNSSTYLRPTSVHIKDEAPSSEDEILAHLLTNDNEIQVKEEVDALAIKDEVYDGDDDERLSDGNSENDYISGATERYACDYCDETFTRKTYMRWHIKECHDTTEHSENQTIEDQNDAMTEYNNDMFECDDNMSEIKTNVKIE